MLALHYVVTLYYNFRVVNFEIGSDEWYLHYIRASVPFTGSHGDYDIVH